MAEAQPPRRLPSLQEWLGGRKQHVLQEGYFPLTYPFPPEWARSPARATVTQNGYTYPDERAAAAARQVIDASAEFERIRSEEPPLWPACPTWHGTTCFGVGE